MDRKKIDSVFENLNRSGLLTKDGSFCYGSTNQFFSIVPARLIVVFLVVFYSCFFVSLVVSDGFGPLGKIGSLIFLVLHFLGFSYGIWNNSSLLYWYRDRLVEKNIFGYNRKEYMYSDMKSIARRRESDSGTLFGNSNPTIKIIFRMPNVEPIQVVDDFRTRQFLSSCFGEIFYVNEELDIMLSFFAKVLKMNALSGYPSEKELQCAVRYFTGLRCYYSMEYEASYFSGRLLSLMKQYNYVSREACMAACREQGYEIMARMARNNMTYANRKDLLASLFEYAYVGDGMVDEEELNFLSQLASTFGIKEWDFLSLKRRFEGEKQEESKRKGDEDTRQQKRYQQVRSNCVQEAFSLLNLRPDASLEEVKSAYRTQVKNCHPDTLPSTATDSEREEAAIRFRAVTEAYDFLCEELRKERVVVS